ncbi:hypothetical protein G8E03_00750 [Pontibrevibacter nitratireducens]|uniref:Type IV pilus biogenesis protein PilP n=2 Tax=Pontivivens nitratireducens TaxID=2758038 RepID=A0A6G7VHN8_9RHOB|nr:hypothetical protein G8E03_00750 [Pontibrevibacter nitratireducens]
MQSGGLTSTLRFAFAAIVIATGAHAHATADFPAPASSAIGPAPAVSMDIPLHGHLSRNVSPVAGLRVAQAGEQTSGAVETSMPPRPRPSGINMSGLVGENSIIGEPVAVDQTGTIVRPRPRATVATDITDRAVVEQLPDTDAPIDVVSEPASDILRPRPRPEGFGREIRSIVTQQQIQRVQEENESTPATATVRNAASDDDRISLDRITLIGVFGTEETRRALLRMPNGDFQPIARGTLVDGWRVLTIDRDTVRIGRNSEVLILEMP